MWDEVWVGVDEVRKCGKQGRWVWMMSGNYLWEAVWMGVDEVRKCGMQCGWVWMR